MVRPSGKAAETTIVNGANPAVVSRADGVETIAVSAEFEGDDTSTLVPLTQIAIRDAFPEEHVAG